MPPADDSIERSDPDLDAAILAADKAREQYVLQRLRTRRRMAIIAFAQFVFGGAAIVIAGLVVKGWAERIDHMGTFLSLYFATLGGVIMAYWGIGAYERNTWGSSMGSMFGSYGSYGIGSGWGGSASRPTLTKTPRSPDGQ